MRARLVHLVACVALGVVAAVASGTVALGAGAPMLRLVASGLNNPRKLVIGPGGVLYVVEAGIGANTATARCRLSCVGASGAVDEIAGGAVRRVVTGLGSVAAPNEEEAEGPAAVLVEPHGYDVLMQDMDITAKGVNRLGLPDAGDLIATPPGKVSAKVIANLAAYEAAHNPDHGAGPGAKYGQPPIDSDPYALVAYRGGFAVADAAANDLLWISPTGRISLLAVFPVQTEPLTAAERLELHAPTLRSLPVQSVPSSVVVGPDGALYVGELTGWPFKPGTARIWRVVAGQKATLYAAGFTNISDLAFDGPDLLVLEITARGLLDPSSPGALIRVAPNGSRRLLVSTGLLDPTGLAVGNGLIYIANDGTFPGSGSGPHGEIVSIPAALGS